MNIQDAIQAAAKKGRGIRRQSWREDGPILIPTNTSLCIILSISENKIIPRWNPSLDDLSADDWEDCIR